MVRTRHQTFMKLTIIYDLETSGFAQFPMISENHRILQICAMDSDTGRIFNKFINPHFPIPEKSSNIHHITDDDVKGAADIDAVIEQLLEFFDASKFKHVELIAHNNNCFDKLVLMKEFKRLGYVLPSNVTFWDTLPFMRENYPGLKSFSLGNLYKHFYDKEIENCHRADADVLALSKIYEEKIKPFRSEPNSYDKVKERIYADCLTKVRFLGPWRAGLLYKKDGIETTSQLREFASKLEGQKPKSFDRYLIDEIGVKNITHRMFIISAVMKLDMWSDELKHLLNFTHNCNETLDCVDYYVKYRYVLNQRPPRPHLYYKGFERARLNIG